MSLDVQNILDRAKGSARVGDHEEAERLFKQYLAKNPDDRFAHLLLGTTLAKEEKLDEAADEFTTLLTKNPQDVEALNNLAVIYRRQDKLQDALGAMLDAIDIDPTRAEFYYNIGNIQKQMGNLKAASMAYSKVVELNPDYVHAYNNLGTIYDQLHEYDKAYNMFRKGLALDRNNPTLHFNYGVALEANGRFSDALDEYKAALRSKPGWLQAMNNMGIILFKQGQHTRAMEAFSRILHTDPLNAEARNNMGVVLADQGKTKEAIENYHRAIEADPKYVKAVVNLERVLEDSGDFADAVVELEKLIKLVPNSVDIRCRLASLYLKMERYPEALQQSMAALDWEPENIQALRIQGATQRVMGNDAEAQKTFEKILTIDPGNYAFQLDLADIHFNRKEYKEAEDRIMAYLARRPNDREAKILLGRLYAEMGNRTHAIQIFEELVKADPNDTEALAAAAELHKDAGEIEKALRTADKLVNLQGKRATPDDLSDLNESLAFYENAVKAYSSEVTRMWDKNLKLLQESFPEKEGGEEDTDLSLFMGATEKAPPMDEETEALFIEDPEVEPEEDDELFLDNELPLVEEEPLPDMSLDNLAETNTSGPAAPAQSPASEAPWPSEPYPESSGMPDYPQYPDFSDYPPPSSQPETPQQEAAQPAFQSEPEPARQEQAPQQAPQPEPPQYPEPPRQEQAPQQAPPSEPPQYPQPPQQEQQQPRQEQAPQQAPQPEPPQYPEPPRQEQIPQQAPPSEPPQYPQPPHYPEPPRYPQPPQQEQQQPRQEQAPQQAPQYPPGDEPEALPIEEPEEELILEDGGEENPQEWAEPETEAFPDEQTLPEDEAIPDETLPEDQVAGGQEALENELGEEEPEDIFADEIPQEEQQAIPEESFPGEPQEEDFPRETSAPTASSQPDISHDSASGPKAEPALTKDSVLGLMKYLKDMSDSLPDKKRENFMQSDARISMEYVINTLEGKKGLLKEIKEKIPSAVSAKPQSATLSLPAVPDKEKIAGTLSYLGDLSTSIADKNLFVALKQKVQNIMSRIKAVTDKGQKNG